MRALDDEWRPGAVVGEHRLLRRLGAGGMGAVDLAEHLPTGARRAIKSIVAPLEPELLQRFQREAEVLARVAGHPHVARVHSAGVACSRPYLVMDFLPGGDLQERLRQGPLPALEVARLGVALASGLAHVHARGILHRDLKPSNVLFDEQDRPVLVDFGLARPSSARSLTATGEVLGTPSFMAPEQALGDKGAIGPRTDVFGLGALLYAALTGRPPADGKSPIEVLTRVLEDAPPPPHTLVRGVPRPLEAALLRALAKRPEQRFATVEELGAALAAAVRDRGRRPTGGRAAAAAAAVGAVLAALGGVAALWPGPPGGDPVAPPAAVASATSTPSPTAVAEAASPPVEDETLPATVAAILPPPAELPVEHIPAGSRLAATVLGKLGEGEALSKQAELLGYPSDHEFHRVAAQAFKLVAQSERDDSGRAWARLGRAFEHGLGVRRSWAEAVRCYERSAALGDVIGQLSLALKLRELPAGAGRDLPRARDLLQKVLRGPATVEAASARLGLAQVALEDPQVFPLQAAFELLGDLPDDSFGADWHLIRASMLERLGRVDEAARECALALEDPGYCGQAAIQRLELLQRAGRTEEAAAARDDLGRRALLQGGCAVSFARLLAGEGAVGEAKELYLWVAERPDERPTWHCRTARSELYRLCLRTGDAGAPVTIARARELLAFEPDGAQLIEQADRAAR